LVAYDLETAARLPVPVAAFGPPAKHAARGQVWGLLSGAAGE
jgi:hypothetical protein